MCDKPGLRLTATLAVLLAASPAFAQTPPARLAAPGELGAAPVSSGISAQEFGALARAMAAAEAGQWETVRTVYGELTDPAGKKLLQWRIATSDNRSTFFDMAAAVRNLQGWPNTNAMRRDAEYALGDMAAGAVRNEDIVRFFTDFPAQTGDGKVAHAEALIALGQRDAAEEILRDAWRQNAMRAATQTRVIALYSGLFSSEDTLERIDYLAFAGQRNAVRELIPLLHPDYQALYRARLSLAGDDADAATRVELVPQRLQGDAGLLYDRARRFRNRGDETRPVELLRQIRTNPKSLTGVAELWALRHVVAREVLEAGNPQAAYDLVKDIGATSGANFADAEFLAGWIALRFLNDPAMAERHFVRLAEGVSTPVSVSRGWYWTGRAREAAGDAAGAADAYARGAVHQSAYYGQLAALELDPAAAIGVTPDPEPTADERARFEQRELVHALRILGELGENDMFFAFAVHLEDELTDAGELIQLSDLAAQYGQTRTALRVAKDGRNRNMPIFERAFPVAFTPPEGAGYAEPALALAISRQETEFDPRAVSGADARGLMQLIPATARTQARKDGVPYEIDWLLNDPEYNVRLGSSHLDDLIQNYNGSYIVSMAAYNAGPGRARQWIERFGDPRHGGIDPIDWVELVPFGETRNYIQRVMENVQVYRAQLNGGAATLEMADDLERGGLPQAAFR